MNDSKTPSQQRYQALNTYKDLNNLIENADCEDLYLECKDQTSPTKISKVNLAKTLSGFSNTSGGVVLWGVHTDKKDGNDVITQLYPIGNIEAFKKRVANLIPTLTVPAIINFELKTIKENSTDTRGFLVGHIPALHNQPTQSVIDNYFYLRSGDQSTKAPYEFIQRMFSSQESPDIVAKFPVELFSYNAKEKVFTIPVVLSNQSYAAGRDIVCFVSIDNDKSFEKITCDKNFKDVSKLNMNKKKFIYNLNEALHKGIETMVGNITIKPKQNGTRIAKISIKVFAHKMIASEFLFKVHLKKQPVITLLKHEKLY